MGRTRSATVAGRHAFSRALANNCLPLGGKRSLMDRAWSATGGDRRARQSGTDQLRSDIGRATSACGSGMVCYGRRSVRKQSGTHQQRSGTRRLTICHWSGTVGHGRRLARNESGISQATVAHRSASGRVWICRARPRAAIGAHTIGQRPASVGHWWGNER